MLTTIVVVFVIYLALMLVISWRGRKHANSFEQYLNVGRSAPLILLVGGAVGAHVGNGLVVGGAGNGAAVGISGAGYGIGCVLSYVVLAFISDKIYHGGWMTPADYFAERYEGKTIGNLFNLICGIVIIPSIGAQMLAAKILFDALGLNGTIGLIALSVVVFLYSQISGLWGAMATSVVQTIVIALGVIAAVIYVFADGGWGVITGAVAAGTLPDSFLNLEGYDIQTWLLLLVPTCLNMIPDPVTWQRINSAESADSARRSFWIASIVMLPMCVAPAIIGMYGRVMYGVADNTAFFQVVLNRFPPLLAALVVVAVVCAVMSTIDGALIGASTLWIRGLYKDVVNKNAEDKQMQKMTLPFNIIIILLAAYVAFTSNTIIGLLTNTYLFLCGSLLAPLLCGWMWKKTTTKGAAVGMIVGAIFVGLQIAGIYELPFSGITSFLPSFFVTFIASALTQEKK